MSRSSSKRSKEDPFPGTVQPPQCQGIHVYLFCTKDGGRYLSHTSGEVTAEELCFLAAQAVGETKRFNTDLRLNICGASMEMKTLKCAWTRFIPQASLPFAMFCLLCTIHCQVSGTVQVTPSRKKFAPLLYSTTVWGEFIFLFDTVKSKINYNEHFHASYVLILRLDIIFGIGMVLLKVSQPYPGIFSNQRQKKSSCLCLMSDLWTICSLRFVFNINCGFTASQFNEHLFGPFVSNRLNMNLSTKQLTWKTWEKRNLVASKMRAWEWLYFKCHTRHYKRAAHYKKLLKKAGNV